MFLLTILILITLSGTVKSKTLSSFSIPGFFFITITKATQVQGSSVSLQDHLWTYYTHISQTWHHSLQDFRQFSCFQYQHCFSVLTGDKETNFSEITVRQTRNFKDQLADVWLAFVHVCNNTNLYTPNS